VDRFSERSCANKINYPVRDDAIHFVSTGFNIAASIAPIVYGMLMDHGQPRGIFFLSAAVSLVCVSTVAFGLSRRQAE
jgi:MFS transporter, FSR family, fosmidomycin resistance protein